MISIQVFALFVITRRCLVISSFFSCAHFSYDVVAYMCMRFALNFFHVYFHLGDLDTVLVPLLSQIWSHIYSRPSLQGISRDWRYLCLIGGLPYCHFDSIIQKMLTFLLIIEAYSIIFIPQFVRQICKIQKLNYLFI